MGSVSTLFTQIERIVHSTSFRGTPWAKFQRTDGFFLADAWFEQGTARMQIRSEANSLEDAATIAVAINMAIDWQAEQIANGHNFPPKDSACKQDGTSGTLNSIESKPPCGKSASIERWSGKEQVMGDSEDVVTTAADETPATETATDTPAETQAEATEAPPAEAAETTEESE